MNIIKVSITGFFFIEHNSFKKNVFTIRGTQVQFFFLMLSSCDHFKSTSYESYGYNPSGEINSQQSVIVNQTLVAFESILTTLMQGKRRNIQCSAPHDTP